MKYDFDEIVDRYGTNCLKYDFSLERGRPKDILPLWVADMDIKAPKEVNDAIKAAADHGIYGYADTKDDYFKTLKNWFSKYHDWEIEREWLVKTPGIVYAIATAIKAFTKAGDSVLIQQPVYYPFSETILVNDRKLVNNPLAYRDGKYSIDFEDFESKIKEKDVKLFILCSPHNPVGRVWTREELTRVGDICVENNVLVIADEIHEDFVNEGHKHQVFSDIKPEYRDITVTCTAPSKTFNIAGLQVSNIFIPNENLRREFKKEMDKTGYSQLNTLGLLAAKAAYDHGREWLDQLKVYLKVNLDFLREFLKDRLPMIKLVEPEGTYLVWIDFKELKLSNKELEHLIVNEANLWLDSGDMFGADGEGFQRINIACPRSVLEKALIQLEAAIKNI